MPRHLQQRDNVLFKWRQVIDNNRARLRLKVKELSLCEKVEKVMVCYVVHHIERSNI